MTALRFASRRSPVYGRNGMVATSQPLATAAGLEILAKGGNAADAAVAAGAALNVTEPTSTGIGGDMFALYYSAESKRVTALNGSGGAPAALTLDRLAKEGFAQELPPFHAHTVTVPGACAGWFDLIEKHGSLSMSDILVPAIRLASEGFPVAPITAYSWQRGVERQLRSALNGHELTIDGRAPKAGEIFHNPNLARTFELVARRGKSAFYEGEIAEAIVRVINEAGGCMSLDDLASHQSTWEEPISAAYRGLRVYECPPNGQGITALIALNILEGFALDSLDSLSTERFHLMIETMRLAFADSRWYVADPKFSNVPVGELLSKNYADERRKLIERSHATIDQKHGTPVSSSGTVYLSVVDKFGNACSFINSNYSGFGTGIVPKGYGFTLQNRGHNFNLDPNHPNALAPRKRPYHTIIPAMVTHQAPRAERSASEVEAGRGAGGEVKIKAKLSMPPTASWVASCNPRDMYKSYLPWLIMDSIPSPRSTCRAFALTWKDQADASRSKKGFLPRVVSDLETMGHPVYSVGGYDRSLFGRGQVILRDAETGVLCAGSDAHADGCAMALI